MTQTPWVECVPNFSEGQRQDFIDRLAESARHADVHLLNVSSDVDHHRTVLTLAGPPEALLEAVFETIRTAAEIIDLDTHRGEHPRMGAADVVPFIPLRGCTLADCVGLAHRLGKRVGRELNLPVFYYEAAARRPERVNLADVRRGGYERLKATMATDPALLPDEGPRQVSPAGAVIIGARQPLIAFNAYLDTADVAVAKAVAARVRTSGRGLPFLKAMGVLVNGQAQVSMNVTDFRQTSLFAVVEAVRTVAAEYGARVISTELVGLVPQSALIDSALAALGLPPEVHSATIEYQLGLQTGDYREIRFE